jgi:predicted permease
MTRLHLAARRLRHFLFGRRSDAEMAEEMRFHLEQRAAELAERGLSPSEARYAAQRRFGNLGSLQEIAREQRGFPDLERFLKDLRLALRQFGRAPGFALLAVVTLGFGIGANTSMFNVLKTVMLKPLPYTASHELDLIYRATVRDPEGGVAAADFLDLRRAAGDHYRVAASTASDVSLSEPGRPAERCASMRVSADFFALLGVQPQLGRGFGAEDEVPGHERSVVLSQRTWRRRFDGRADVLGLRIRVDGEPHTIVGVLPESFNDWRHLGWVDLFRPLALDREAATDRGGVSLGLLGRRAPGRSPDEARRFLAAFGQGLAAEFPESHAGSAWRSVPLDSAVSGKRSGASLALLIGLSAFVLLIACSNLANLLLARTMARARDFAVRAALGASRVQLLRPLIAESLLLALAGGLCALAVALAVGHWLALRSTGDNGERVIFAVDWPVFGWAVVASLVTALAFGLAPALFAMRLDLNDVMKGGGRGLGGGRGHRRFRQALVVGQFALAMVLLAGAGLFIRGLHELNTRRTGWESAGLVTGTFRLPAADYAGPEQVLAFQRRALARLESLPGVTTASLSRFAPFLGWAETRRFVVEGASRPEPGREPGALVNVVTPRYFEAVGTPLVAGRVFGDGDAADAPRVFIVNRSLARGLFGEAGALGRRLVQLDGESPRSGEIVGVVADVESAVSDRSPIVFQVYVPMAQEPQRAVELSVRAAGAAPAALVADIRAAMAELDPDLPVRRLQDADGRILRANYQLAVFRDMLVGFALLGLGLAGSGIYGVVTRAVAQRTGEFALRLALGARLADLTRLVLLSGLGQALAGSAIGLVGVFGVSRLTAAAFPEVRAHDPGVVLGTTLALALLALVACWLPARRTGRIDATAVLRAE